MPMYPADPSIPRCAAWVCDHVEIEERRCRRKPRKGSLFCTQHIKANVRAHERAAAKWRAKLEKK